MSEPQSDQEANHPHEFVDFVKRVLFVVVVVALVWFLYLTRHAILLALTAAIFSAILAGLSLKLRKILPWGKQKWAYRSSLMIVMLGIVLVVAGLTTLIGGKVSSDLKDLSGKVPTAIESLRSFGPVNQFIRNGGENQDLGTLFSQASSTAMTMASGFASLLGGLVVILFTAAFLAAEPPLYKRWAVSFFPESMRPKVDSLLDKCAHSLWGWLVGQSFAMLIIAVLTTIGLLAIGMDYALTLGLIAGILQFIPYVGPLLSAIPALLVAVTISPQMILIVAGLYFLIQFLEGNFITPLVLQKKVHIPPAITLLATMTFGLAFGPLGVIIATPLSVLVMVLYQEVYQREVLGTTGSDNAQEEKAEAQS